jgi:ABC-type enterobactin transport system permease subunit
MQKALSALLFVLTGACLTIGGIILSTLFDDYKDSPDSTYIETAAVPLVLGALFLVAGILTLRKYPS